jgi:DNA-binding MarR family transcriptional regulator
MSDEVDRIVSAWRRERPDLDVAPLEILSRITRVARQLDIARRNAFSHHGLETWGFDVLAALRRAGKPYQLTPGQLMHETLVSSGTITHRLDLLEGAGFLSRNADPSDGRGSLVKITALGIKAVDASMADLLLREKELINSLDASQQKVLATLLGVVLNNLDQV